MTTATAKPTRPDPAAVEAALRLSAVADPNRLGVLLILEGGPRNVTELRAALGVEGATALSHHLQVLRHARMVVSVREGVYIYYGISADGQSLLDGLRPLLEGDPDD